MKKIIFPSILIVMAFSVFGMGHRDDLDITDLKGEYNLEPVFLGGIKDYAFIDKNTIFYVKGNKEDSGNEFYILNRLKDEVEAIENPNTNNELEIRTIWEIKFDAYNNQIYVFFALGSSSGMGPFTEYRTLRFSLSEKKWYEVVVPETVFILSNSWIKNDGKILSNGSNAENCIFEFDPLSGNIIKIDYPEPEMTNVVLINDSQVLLSKKENEDSSLRHFYIFDIDEVEGREYQNLIVGNYDYYVHIKNTEFYTVDYYEHDYPEGKSRIVMIDINSGSEEIIALNGLPREILKFKHAFEDYYTLILSDLSGDINSGLFMIRLPQ